jgi:hypothetical protein
VVHPERLEFQFREEPWEEKACERGRPAAVLYEIIKLEDRRFRAAFHFNDHHAAYTPITVFMNRNPVGKEQWFHDE